MHQYQRTICNGAFLLLLGFCLGCGPPRCSVEGRVTFDDKPIESGNIRLDSISNSKGDSAGAKIIDGKFTIPKDKGLRSGKYQVTITAIRKTGRTIKNVERLEGTAAEREEVIQYIPERYNTGTELTVELSGGENTDKNFKLTSDK